MPKQLRAQVKFQEVNKKKHCLISSLCFASYRCLMQWNTVEMTQNRRWNTSACHRKRSLIFFNQSSSNIIIIIRSSFTWEVKISPLPSLMRWRRQYIAKAAWENQLSHRLKQLHYLLFLVRNSTFQQLSFVTFCVEDSLIEPVNIRLLQLKKCE